MSPRKDKNMWLENLKELKKESGMTTKQIAAAAHLPERTVIRIFSGETDNPYVDTLNRIVAACGKTLNDIFADTDVVVATETFVAVKENAEVVEAEKDLALREIEALKAKVAAQEAEIMLLKERLQHKEELLAVHNYYLKRGLNDQ